MLYIHFVYCIDGSDIFFLIKVYSRTRDEARRSTNGNNAHSDLEHLFTKHTKNCPGWPSNPQQVHRIKHKATHAIKRLLKSVLKGSNFMKRHGIIDIIWISNIL